MDDMIGWLDYQTAVRLWRADVGFYALIAAAMLRADSDNVELLKSAFPGVYGELRERYNAPGGFIQDETLTERAQAVLEAPSLVTA